jgi:hypothetical protein
LVRQCVIGNCLWQPIEAPQSVPKNIGPFWIKMDLGVPLEFRSIAAHPDPDAIISAALAVVGYIRETT